MLNDVVKDIVEKWEKYWFLTVVRELRNPIPDDMLKYSPPLVSYRRIISIYRRPTMPHCVRKCQSIPMYCWFFRFMPIRFQWGYWISWVSGSQPTRAEACCISSDKLRFSGIPPKRYCLGNAPFLLSEKRLSHGICVGFGKWRGDTRHSVPLHSCEGNQETSKICR